METLHGGNLVNERSQKRFEIVKWHLSTDLFFLIYEVKY